MITYYLLKLYQNLLNRVPRKYNFKLGITLGRIVRVQNCIFNMSSQVWTRLSHRMRKIAANRLEQNNTPFPS